MGGESGAILSVVGIARCAGKVQRVITPVVGGKGKREAAAVGDFLRPRNGRRVLDNYGNYYYNARPGEAKLY